MKVKNPIYKFIPYNYFRKFKKCLQFELMNNNQGDKNEISLICNQK